MQVDASEYGRYIDGTRDWNFDGATLVLRSQATNAMHLTKDNVYQFSICFDLPKYSSLTNSFNQIILNYLAGGLVERWDNIIKEETKPIVEPYFHRQLNLYHFSGCFYCVGFGYCIATFVFFCEKVFYWYKNCRREGMRRKKRSQIRNNRILLTKQAFQSYI